MRTFCSNTILYGRVFHHCVLSIIGAVFWILAWTEKFSMEAVHFGSDVVDIPAEVWAMLMLFPSVGYVWAAWINGCRPLITPVTRIACAMVVWWQFAFFVVSAFPVAGFNIVVVWAAVFAVVELMIIAYEAWVFAYRWRRVRGR